jgi:hypothetical protein
MSATKEEFQTVVNAFLSDAEIRVGVINTMRNSDELDEKKKSYLPENVKYLDMVYFTRVFFGHYLIVVEGDTIVFNDMKQYVIDSHPDDLEVYEFVMSEMFPLD